MATTFRSSRHVCGPFSVTDARSGPAGAFYCHVIEDVLKRADKAAIEQDLPAMICIYKEMQEIKE